MIPLAHNAGYIYIDISELFSTPNVLQITVTEFFFSLFEKKIVSYYTFASKVQNNNILFAESCTTELHKNIEFLNCKNIANILLHWLITYYNTNISIKN